jgi:hypothetical protein
VTSGVNGRSARRDLWNLAMAGLGAASELGRPVREMGGTARTRRRPAPLTPYTPRYELLRAALAEAGKDEHGAVVDQGPPSWPPATHFVGISLSGSMRPAAVPLIQGGS